LEAVASAAAALVEEASVEVGAFAVEALVEEASVVEDFAERVGAAVGGAAAALQEQVSAWDLALVWRELMAPSAIPMDTAMVILTATALTVTTMDASGFAASGLPTDSAFGQ
jgi:hypothetical protein